MTSSGFFLCASLLATFLSKRLHEMENIVLERLAWQDGSPVFELLGSSGQTNYMHDDHAHPTQLYV